MASGFLLGFAGCTSPNLIREVQTAEPLRAGSTSLDVNGGFQWAPMVPAKNFAPDAPSASAGLLLRHACFAGNEIQVPINACYDLWPEWNVLQISAGALWKKSVLLDISMADSLLSKLDPQPDLFYHRPLYRAIIVGPVAGAQITDVRIFQNSYDNLDYYPYAGLYLKTVHEARLSDAIRLRGLIVNLNMYAQQRELPDNPLLLCEAILGGYTGSEEKWGVFQFTYGVAWHPPFGLKAFLGTSFASKPRRGRT